MATVAQQTNPIDAAAFAPFSECDRELVSIGRRVAFAEARLVDANGRLYASATSTLLVFERPTA